jgi:hypothetical protein
MAKTATNDAILKRIVEEYRPYNTFLAFREGYRAYQTGAHAQNPYGDTAEGQAWDRGGCAAMQYGRALAHLDAHPADAAEPAATAGWLQRLLEGRC